MWLKYFDYKGERYYTGTVVKLHMKSTYCGILEREAVFVAHDPETHHCLYLVGHCINNLKEEAFFNNIYEVTNRMEATRANESYERWTRPRVTRKKSEFEIPGMLAAWIVYIAAMFGSFIFNQWFFAWILVSIIFYSYRDSVLKREGWK